MTTSENNSEGDFSDWDGSPLTFEDCLNAGHIVLDPKDDDLLLPIEEDMECKKTKYPPAVDEDLDAETEEDFDEK